MRILITRSIQAPSTPELGTPTSTSFDSMTIPLTRPSTGYSPLARYEIERASSPTGPFVTQASGPLIFGNPPTAYGAGGLIANTAYYWRALAVDTANRISGYSAVVSGVTAAASGNAISFNPGWYWGYYPASQSIITGFRFDHTIHRQAWLDFINQWVIGRPTIRGVQISGCWKAFEFQKNNYAPGMAVIHDLLALLATDNKLAMLSMYPVYFGQSGSAYRDIFPDYLIDEAGYGLAGIGYSTTPPGNAGRAAKTWQTQSSDALIRVMNAWGTEFNGHPNVEKTVLAETALQAVDPTYTNAALYDELARQTAAIRPTWKNKGVRLALNFTDSLSRTSQLMASAAANDMSVGGGDIDVTSIIEGNQVYVGAQGSPTPIDYRGVVPFDAEFQSPEYSANTISAMYYGNLNGYTATRQSVGVFQPPTYASYFIMQANPGQGPPFQTQTDFMNFINSVGGRVGNGLNSTPTLPSQIPAPSGYAGGITRLPSI
jgi:hypothetical protein